MQEHSKDLLIEQPSRFRVQSASWPLYRLNLIITTLWSVLIVIVHHILGEPLTWAGAWTDSLIFCVGLLTNVLTLWVVIHLGEWIGNWIKKNVLE